MPLTSGLVSSRETCNRPCTYAQVHVCEREPCEDGVRYKGEVRGDERVRWN